MTNDRLQLVLCDVYEPDVRALAPEAFGDVDFRFFAERCRMPFVEWPEVDALFPECCGAAGPCTVIGASSCMHQLSAPAAAAVGVDVIAMQQCLHLVAPRHLVDLEQKEGAYCVTSGWLARWQRQMDLWGLDRETATAFFAESATSVVLLDTLGDEESHRNLEAFARFVSLPSRALSVGLGHFENVLTHIIQARRPKRPQRRTSVMRQQLQADHALALDLLGTLFKEGRSESGAFQGIMDALWMLFAADTVRVLAPRTGAPDLLYEMGVPEPCVAPESLREQFAGCTNGHSMAQDGTGFQFQMALGDATMGIVEVAGVAIPSAILEYVNLALALAPVCAAVVANARAYDEVRAARELLEHSNSALQKTNDDLMAARAELRELQEVLPICGWCHSILDQQGAWSRLAAYLVANSGAKLSHGICAACIEKEFDAAQPE